MEYLSIRNWERYQHYRDRKPPWIKLYAAILQDPEFCDLSDESRYHLLALFVLASQHENLIPFKRDWIAKQIFANSPIDWDGLIDSRFLFITAEQDATQGAQTEQWSTRYIPEVIRLGFLTQCRHRCLVCGSKRNLEIDHIVPISQGGDSSPANLQVLCRSCNRRKRIGTLQLSAEQLATQKRIQDAVLRSKNVNLRSLETETYKEEKETEKETDPQTPKGGSLGSNNLFDQFYAAYPRHESPKKAREAWNKLEVDEPLLERMLEWLKAAAISDQWRDKALIPHPSTWLNQRRWEGDPPPQHELGHDTTWILDSGRQHGKQGS